MMPLFPAAIAILGAVLSTGPAGALPAGRVVDARNDAVPGAIVTFFDSANPARRRRVVTDASGRFARPDGAWDALAVFSNGDGFAVVRPLASSDDLGAVVLARGATLRGTVFSDGGAPVARAIVRVAMEPPLRPFRAATRTDERGRFEFAGLPAGAASVAVSPPAAPASARRIVIFPDSATETTFVVGEGEPARARARAAPKDAAEDRPTAPVRLDGPRGIALSENGAPVPGVVVSIENEAAGLYSEAVTDAAGRFRFERGAASGSTTRIEALGAVHAGAFESDRIGAAAGTDVVLVLTRLGALRGRLLPLPAADADDNTDDLVILLERIERTTPPVRIDCAAGPFLAAGIEPGDYDLCVIRSGRVVLHEPSLRIDAGIETDLGEIALPPAEAEPPRPSAEDPRGEDGA